ncbi:MAG: glycosyltransferase family 39 protein, partial [Acidobacteria bacterium]|nr:glycosyltransferase family 39 protein [Acidobacteriota bacterium]
MPLALEFRDAEGFLTGRFSFPLSLAVAVVILAVSLGRKWSKSGCWMALAVAGQAAAIQAIEAGKMMHYQHYKALGRLIPESDPPVLLFLALQSVLVAAGLRGKLGVILAWLLRQFGWWRLAAIAALAFGASATVSRDAAFYAAELALAVFLAALNLANIVLAAWDLPAESAAALRRRFGAPHDDVQPGGLDRFAIVGAVWVTAVAAVLSYFSYERHPHIPDEVVYIYHARYLAAGMLSMPAPPDLDAFHLNLMNYEKDRWFCPVPPGWPFLLAVGEFLGAGWLVNPILGGLVVLLAYLLLREIAPRRTARLAVLLLCLSPWHLFMSMNFMTHNFTLLCALVAAWAVARSRRGGGARWAWLAGCATGVGSLIRPLDGLIAGAIVGLWALGLGARRLTLPSLAAFAAGAALVGAAVLPYNRLLTGDPLKAPIMAYTDKYYGPKTNALGFGPERGLGWPLDPYPGHTPLESLINA